MRRLSEFLYELIPIFLFCAAVTLLLFHFKSLSASYQCIKSSIANNEILYESSNLLDKQKYMSDDGKVSKKELLITLVSGLTYDVEIDGILYCKDTFDYESFNFTSLQECYEKRYQYDKDGKIKEVCYIRKENGE